MEAWFTILVSLCICAIIRSLLSLINLSKKAKYNNLPPGPPSFPIIGNLFWLTKSLRDIEGILKGLRGKYGPIITLHVGSRPAIFVADRSLAHQALVQNGAIYSDRPKAVVTSRIISSNQHNISSALYGPTWRLLRRNLSLEILHPSRVKSYSHARTWVLDILIDRLKFQAKSGEPVELMNHFRYAMFCLLVLMCFGDKLEEKQIKEIEDVHRRMLLGFGRFNVLNFWPKISKILFRNRWKQFFEIVKDRENVLAPLIAARRKLKEESQSNEGKEEKDYVVAYVDGLLDLELPDENRKLKEDEMVSLCSEFITAGTDTTSTVLQWIMANLVKHQHVQERLYDEIKQVVGESKIVTEDDLQKMKYLKSVILEGLRRHPPGHFVLPHAVTEETDLGGYFIPKNASVNFMVAEMGWDSEVWEDPMEFKPERFLNSVKQDGFDITGSKEIKMMPFGAGRRICPGLALAMLHLEYFVANLVWQFVWKPVNNDQVDLSEKLEFTVVMKNPLQARISSRQDYH